MRTVLFVALFASAACKPSAPSAEETEKLLQTVRGRLAERERKLQSFALKGSTTEGTQTLAYAFAYRAPNKMRAVFFTEPGREFVFDGETLHEVSVEKKKAYRYAFALPKEQASLFLNQLFAPVVPEGFRTPLIAARNVRVERFAHPKAPEAIRITQTAGEGADAPIDVITELRWPSLDFLGKKTGGSQLTVEAEHCDTARSVCVPQKLTQLFNPGGATAQTELTEIDLNAPLPADAFTLKLPEGFTLEDKTLSAPTLTPGP